MLQLLAGWKLVEADRQLGLLADAVTPAKGRQS